LHAAIVSLLEAGWLLVAILLPLWVNLWAAHPFGLSKAVMLRMLVGLELALALATTLLSERGPWRYVPPLLLWSVGLLAVILLLASFAGVSLSLSLWGSLERGQGTVTQLSYLVLFLIVAAYCAPCTRQRRLVIALVVTGVPIVLIAFAQSLGWRPLPLVTDARSPVFATLGRANFVGAYLAMLLPLTLALTTTAQENAHRFALAVLAVGEVVVLGLTDARGAWLAAAVGIAFFAVLAGGGRLTDRWRYLAWAGLAALILGGPLSAVWLSTRQQGSPAARIAIWRSALQLIRERPLLGYGPEALVLVFPRVFPPELVYYQGRQFFVDRAHNWVLDWAVSTGFVGLLAYLLVLIVWAVLAGQALQRAKHRRHRLLLVGAVAAVGANLTNNLLSFDVTPTAMASWMLMGLVAAGVRGRPNPAPIARLSPWRKAAALVVASLVALSLFFVTGRPLLADVALKRSVDLARAGNKQAAIAVAQQAVRRRPTEPTYRENLSRLYWDQARRVPKPLPWLERAERALLAARDLRPQDFRLWLAVADFYAAAASDFGANTLPQADAAFAQAARLAPNHAVVYAGWGHIVLEADQPERALPLLQRAVALDTTDPRAYIALGDAELALGRREAALAAYRESVRLEPEWSTAHAALAGALWLSGRSDEARGALTRAMALDPGDARALALTYEFGMISK
jgi:tetratricopeptide (TPR) repeat protein